MNVDVNRLLDEGRWSTFQKLLIAGTALTIILDGIDNQLLATAIPTMMKEWTLKRGDFSTALAMSPLGMLAGGVIGGWLGDRIGRRTALLWSVLIFALPTILIYFANTLGILCLLRFFAGLGLGGAMPSATALASEYVPRRQRPFAVTLTIVCVPVGATLAAEMSAHVIPLYGWRMLFLAGGLIPFVLGLILFAILPESPRFLAARHRHWPRLRALLQRIGHDVPADATFGTAETGNVANTPRGAFVQLFSKALRRDTLSLIASFFCCLLVVYLSLQLLVTALASAGFSEFDARRTLFWWNVGGVIGALLGALVIQRLGSKATMLALCVVAVVSSLSLAALPLRKADAAPLPAATGPVAAHVENSPAAATPASAAGAPAAAPSTPKFTLDSPLGIALIVLCVIMGAAINAVQVALYALAAHVYPTEIRGTGLGATIAFGRVGNVLASYVGNFALNYGISAYFEASGIGMILVLISLALVRQHIDRTPAQSAVPQRALEVVEQ